jgi:hypothetical protein
MKTPHQDSLIRQASMLSVRRATLKLGSKSYLTVPLDLMLWHRIRCASGRLTTIISQLKDDRVFYNKSATIVPLQPTEGNDAHSREIEGDDGPQAQ